MKYVYILESLGLAHFYVGITGHLNARLAKYNAGDVVHTDNSKP
jgi:predicted GIY-YIG superfamily endonuclease